MTTYNPQTTFDAVVALAHIVLRFRGQWHEGATAYCDIDRAVNECADLLPEGSRAICESAVAELKRRCGARA